MKVLSFVSECVCFLTHGVGVVRTIVGWMKADEIISEAFVLKCPALMDQMKARLPLALRFVPSDIVKNIGSAKVISL